MWRRQRQILWKREAVLLLMYINLAVIIFRIPDNAYHREYQRMKTYRRLLSGGIRFKIFFVLLITIVLIIAAYTAVFFYQTNKVEKLVNDTYEAQKQIYVENGLEDEYEAVRSDAVATFHEEMFHARNILILLVVLIVAAG